MGAVAATYDDDIQMIGSISVCAHWQGATEKGESRSLSRSVPGRSHEEIHAGRIRWSLCERGAMANISLRPAPLRRWTGWSSPALPSNGWAGIQGYEFRLVQREIKRATLLGSRRVSCLFRCAEAGT